MRFRPSRANRVWVHRARAGAWLFAACASFASVREARPAGSGDTPPDSVALSSARTRTVVAGDRYRAGAFHRFLLGSDYRDLWTAPVEVPELDLRTCAGGLRPVRRVGGQQTPGLAMKGADGRDYTFRGLDKDPSEILPSEFHGTFVDRIVQDQIASSFPGASVAVAPLLRAAGVLYSEAIMVVMPDDSLLGEFRSTFAGLMGTFEVYPRAADGENPGSFGASEIITGEELWKRMDEDPSARADSRAFLTARLVDMLIGDWDRHRGQWRWAKLPDRARWQPIPEDRDQAFVRFEGLIPTAGRARFPQFVTFEEDYPGVEGLTWNGRDGDRRILVDMEKPVWDDVARDLTSRISDTVIAEAVSRIPAAYRALEGADLENNLRHRRDQLPEIADRFYYFLADKVDVRATDGADVALVNHRDNGDTEVTVSSSQSGAAGTPYFRRVFHPDETEEVRIYLLGGADSVVTTGAPGKIIVRVIGGDGDDHVDDRAGTHLRVSDSSGENRVLAGSGTRIDTRPYTPPKRDKAEWIPPRDWGRRNFFYPWIGGNSDLGVLFLVGLESKGYGFRKDPYADDQSLRVAYATRAGSLGVDYTGEFRRQNSETYLRLYAVASGLEFLHFYGVGNETPSLEDEDFYKVKHTEYVFKPALVHGFGRGWETDVHVSAGYSKTDLEADRFITTVVPYGAEDFFQAGTGVGISLDRRDSETAPTSGLFLSADSNVFPEVGAVESTFGEVHGDVRFYQRIPVLNTPTLALRAGGRQVWGDYPYHEAAYIGGGGTLRGFPRQRFAGDASVFGNAEFRIPLRRLYIFVPGTLGVYGLFDTGRVYVDGESSDKWHSGAGGGLWFAFLNQANTASLSIASSDEGTRVYIHAGLAF